ncbi:MAG: hypothetical protein CEE43_19000 [Promethearchaeota archaeon Loki_b32]|nr:MAG: hypothetical protein CEE43_19000 [Candidatus Lokiarchaeota archaeon Loki_b32]
MTRHYPSFAIITALEKEYRTVKILFKHRTKEIIEEVSSSEEVSKRVFGEIHSIDGGIHEVVLSKLPDMGNLEAAVECEKLLQTYKSIRHVLMVGIAGGIPNLKKPKHHVRLGDIVVSKGVIDYGNVKLESLRYNKIIPRPKNRKASDMLVENAKKLKNISDSQKPPWIEHIARCARELGVTRPTKDILWVLERNENGKNLLREL